MLWVTVPMKSGSTRTLPVLVEYDRTGKVPYNLRKLQNHDVWRTIIARHHPQFDGLETTSAPSSSSPRTAITSSS
jgi:hypothetical protein